MNYYEQMFNQQYVNPQYYQANLYQIQQYNYEQNKEVMNAAKAMRDLCKAVKKLDAQHQQEAFYACLAVMAEERNWR